jgi:hypothetical protein
MNLEIDNENIEKSFNRIATDIMNNWILKAGDKSYRICELEFYYKSVSHQDPYIHGHELQKQMGKWYFHGSGLDLTFGNVEDPGSILIRSIYNIDNQRYIYGPLNTASELLGNLPGINGGNFSLRLEPDDMGKIKSEEKIKPIKAPRVGLKAEKDLNGFFCQMDYRFFVMPGENHIGKEVALKNSNLSDTEIKEILGYNIKR